MPGVNPRNFLITTALLCLIHLSAFAQADATAQRPVDVSVFGGATAVYTGLSQGRNKSVTVGVDLNLPEVYHIRPSLEVRATAPYDRGRVDAQKEILGGLKLETRFNRFHPYAQFLVGRGRLTFNGPYTRSDGSFLYSQPDSTVFSPGAGIRVDLIGNLSALADAQLQTWNTPASLSGHLFSKPLTIGLVYRFTSFRKGPPRK